jgi:hypothetical protein
LEEAVPCHSACCVNVRSLAVTLLWAASVKHLTSWLVVGPRAQGWLLSRAVGLGGACPVIAHF